MLFFKEQRERIAHGCSFVPERPEHLAHGRSLKKCDWAKSNGSDSLFGKKGGKTVKNIWKIWIFSSELLVYEQPKPLAHGRSFEKSDKSELLPTHFKRERQSEVQGSEEQQERDSLLGIKK